MQMIARAGLALVSVLLCGAGLASAQAVPARLSLYQDPTPATSADQLVLGRTTLDEARRLFPDAPTHQGPMPYAGNPQYHKHKPDLDIGGAIVKLRHTFWLGEGRAVLGFDENQRLVLIEHGRFGWADPLTGESKTEIVSWDSTVVTRNDFRQRYPQTRGWWFDQIHYHIEGKVTDCVAVAAFFYQINGQDKLSTLGYRYICPTRPIQGL